MIIENLAKLTDWCHDRIVADLDSQAAPHAAECCAGVIWRHAIGQGLRPGDDWGWILETYDSARLREIVQAAAEIDPRRRR